MELNKLTAQIAAMYYGCEIELHFLDNNIPESLKDISRGILNLGTMGEFMGWGHQRHRLILKPLSEISDEHVIEAAKMELMHVNQFEPLKVTKRTSYTEIDFRFVSPDINNKDGYSYSGIGVSHLWMSLKPYQIDYLRSKGYDCGYGSISSLIESGIATNCNA